MLLRRTFLGRLSARVVIVGVYPPAPFAIVGDDDVYLVLVQKRCVRLAEQGGHSSPVCQFGIGGGEDGKLANEIVGADRRFERFQGR